MKYHAKWLMLLMLLTLVVATVKTSAQDAASNEQLLKKTANLESLFRVTAEPVPMQSDVAFLCNPPGTVATIPHRGSGEWITYLHVYVTANATNAMRQPNTTFPEGAIILKHKFVAPYFTATTPTAPVLSGHPWSSNSTNSPVLYTGMLKREKGYNPDCGDWEFFTISGDGKKVTSRGKTKSCMDCHKDYSKNDFVSKRYCAGHEP